MRIVVITHSTLDGVVHGSGRADDHTRGGFIHGGWAEPADDPAMGGAIGEKWATPDGGLLLLGSGQRLFDEDVHASRRRLTTSAATAHRRDHRELPGRRAMSSEAGGGHDQCTRRRGRSM